MPLSILINVAQKNYISNINIFIIISKQSREASFLLQVWASNTNKNVSIIIFSILGTLLITKQMLL